MSKKNFTLIAILVGIVGVAVVSDILVRKYVDLEGSGGPSAHSIETGHGAGGEDEVPIIELPLRTPAQSVDELSFSIDDDGVKEFRLQAQAFRWEYEPGSDLFVVYSDGRLTDEAGFPLLLNRTFAVKFTKLFRF